MQVGFFLIKPISIRFAGSMIEPEQKVALEIDHKSNFLDLENDGLSAQFNGKN